MADHLIPHFHNDLGVPSIDVRSEGIYVHRRETAFRPSSHFYRYGLRCRGDMFLLFDSLRLRRRARRDLARRPSASCAKPRDACDGARSSLAPGIGGLATAIALSQTGFNVTLYERANKLEEFGAGLQLTPNATRILSQLGVLDRVRQFASRPRAVQRCAVRITPS